ncbi:hypothetical protein FALCPG4_012597 [Fusarium falciforme]
MKRACDPCRRRKIKCDGFQPCATCHTSGFSCSYNAPVLKRGPRRKSPALSRPSQDPSPVSSLSQHERYSSAADSNADRDSPGGRDSGLVPPDRAESGPDLASNSNAVIDLGLVVLNAEKALGRHVEGLVADLRRLLPSIPITNIIETHVDAFFERLFPLWPICHETSIRTTAQRFFGAPPDGPIAAGNGPDADSSQASAERLRSYTLLLAVCTATAACIPGLLPNHHHPHRDAVAIDLRGVFRSATRNMLREYEDFDLQQPNHSSITIRSLLSASLQHSTGHSNLAWHILGQAGLLAQTLRLHREESLGNFDPLEATLLRRTFWNIYTADQSAIVMSNRPVVLASGLLGGELDATFQGSIDVPLIAEPTLGKGRQSIEEIYLQGRQVICQGWTQAARIVSAMRGFKTVPAHVRPGCTSLPDSSHITAMYLEFSGLLDRMPPDIRAADNLVPSDSSFTAHEIFNMRKHRLHILVMFSAAKLLILRQAIESGMALQLGIAQDDTMLTMAQINAARDLIYVFQAAPSDALRSLGEPGAELGRAAGSILLEISVEGPSNTLQAYSKSLLETLLDILAVFDSAVLEQIIK